MRDGFVKVSAFTPDLIVADCVYNSAQIISAAKTAQKQGVKLLVTPELGITAYTCNDLFYQKRLLDEAEVALLNICTATAKLNLVLIVGLPLRHKGKLYNCAAVLCSGRVLAFVPKSNLPNYGEFYEQRQFTSAENENSIFSSQHFSNIPFGTDILFTCEQMPGFCFSVEICEDLWVPAPPSLRHAQAGALLIANLSASNETIGKSEYRRQLVTGQSARLVSAYVYADAGRGESTTDIVFSGHNLIAENGDLLAEGKPFYDEMTTADVDFERLSYERRRLNTYPAINDIGYLHLSFSLKTEQTVLQRTYSPTPFVPAVNDMRDARCETILSIQSVGLAKRLLHTKATTAVVGLSGGLDSALALLVMVRAFKTLKRPLSDIVAVTMPAFGTTARTLDNAERLANALGVHIERIDISQTVRQHLKDISHPEENQDVVYENAQARMRTMVLMNIANQRGGLVIGTGDLSELALGWATYNGDHMSMYGVNASVPKTLVRYIVAYEASINPAAKAVLHDILDTPVSPELLPAKDGVISQKTEDLVGPYEIHDFILYYALRWGFTPKKVFRIIKLAFNEKYDDKTLLHWLFVFYKRFFAQQFKRSCLPDGPKVGSVSLSPRGDLRMPSDASATLWLTQVEELTQKPNP
ncbi:MAG: NAD(+) synthase [Oscillospiraceae bacterium]